MNHKQIAGFFLLIWMVSCQTVSYISEPLPRKVQDLFTTCEGDGGIILKAEEQGATLFVSEADWLMKDDSWTIEAYNGFGRTMASVHAQLLQHKLTLHTLFLDDIKLSMNTEGELLLNDYFVGILAHEVPCLLKQRLPASWVHKITKFSRKKNGATLSIDDSSRQIKLVIDELNGASPSFCAVISWSQMLGLVNQDFEYCYLGSNGKSRMNFTNGVSIQWYPLPII